MIEVRNLNKSFGNFKSLDNLSLNVKKGSVYGLVGPNGAGKTTLSERLSRLLKLPKLLFRFLTSIIFRPPYKYF